MQVNEETDEWEKKLDSKVAELKQCQESNNLNSCTPCDKFFECELRKEYILAVYESMNKGSGGGFEF
ncbi:hypothetical protein [Halarcobacter anaerophilus]|jgi:hypothetical protein|uniref:Uncharacterized protein n=1 Tax=Halarcobacter anaerophilus TaxID=877500 RepID=A0A4Q0Y0T5_9BACT|nr:hypothetical protein [Halarcobacter anaerophilus]QDF29023.1 hypothetical protein AANAER_1546 [Halarcobacter anaerophilus]RXJ63656.1 hypothetical protein CRV06_05555 [Halarcobacter anaerophilus]